MNSDIHQQPALTGGVKYAKNPPAALSYYCGLSSVLALIPIPFILLPLPMVALWLGLMGLKKANAQPHLRGRIHSWIGISCGTIFGLLGLAMSTVCLMHIVAYFNQPAP